MKKSLFKDRIFTEKDASGTILLDDGGEIKMNSSTLIEIQKQQERSFK